MQLTTVNIARLVLSSYYGELHTCHVKRAKPSLFLRTQTRANQHSTNFIGSFFTPSVCLRNNLPFVKSVSTQKTTTTDYYFRMNCWSCRQKQVGRSKTNFLNAQTEEFFAPASFVVITNNNGPSSSVCCMRFKNWAASWHQALFFYFCLVCN